MLQPQPYNQLCYLVLRYLELVNLWSTTLVRWHVVIYLYLLIALVYCINQIIIGCTMCHVCAHFVLCLLDSAQACSRSAPAQLNINNLSFLNFGCVCLPQICNKAANDRLCAIITMFYPRYRDTPHRGLVPRLAVQVIWRFWVIIPIVALKPIKNILASACMCIILSYWWFLLHLSAKQFIIIVTIINLLRSRSPVTRDKLSRFIYLTLGSKIILGYNLWTLSADSEYEWSISDFLT